MNKHVINLDLHGGDFAPGSVLEGATIALSQNPSIHFKLHSTKEFQQQYSIKFSSLFQKSDWVQSENYISSDLKPSEALKKDNRKSSMSNAIAELKDYDSEITISAGNTGAMMAYATVYL